MNDASCNHIHISVSVRRKSDHLDGFSRVCQCERWSLPWHPCHIHYTISTRYVPLLAAVVQAWCNRALFIVVRDPETHATTSKEEDKACLVFFFSWGLQTNTLKMRSGQASRPFCMEKHIGSLHGNTRNPMAWLQGKLGQGPWGQRGDQWGKKSTYISHTAAHLRPDWTPNTASNILWTSFFQNNQQRTSLRGAWPSWKPCNHKSPKIYTKTTTEGLKQCDKLNAICAFDASYA